MLQVELGANENKINKVEQKQKKNDFEIQLSFTSNTINILITYLIKI